MKKAEIKVYKEQLLALRARLAGRRDGHGQRGPEQNGWEANGDLSSMPIHMADIGSDNFEQEFTLSLMQTDEMTLESIESAIERSKTACSAMCEECTGKSARPGSTRFPILRCA